MKIERKINSSKVNKKPSSLYPVSSTAVNTIANELGLKVDSPDNIAYTLSKGDASVSLVLTNDGYELSGDIYSGEIFEGGSSEELKADLEELF